MKYHEGENLSLRIEKITVEPHDLLSPFSSLLANDPKKLTSRVVSRGTHRDVSRVSSRFIGAVLRDGY